MTILGSNGGSASEGAGRVLRWRDRLGRPAGEKSGSIRRSPLRPSLFSPNRPRLSKFFFGHLNRLAAALLALALASPAGAQTVAQTTNGSIVITTGATFQVVLAAVTTTPQRRSLTINNNNASDSCWIYLGAGTATKGTSILLLAGASYRRDGPYIPSDEIQATCANSGDSIYLDAQ